MCIRDRILLFIVLFVCSRIKVVKERSGLLAVLFIIGYAVSRMIVELFREPDAHIGFLTYGVTMGQVLSGGMVLGAAGLFVYIMKTHNVKT